MKIRLLAVGRRMPGWVSDGFTQYQRRLPRHLNLALTEITPGQRAAGSGVERAVAGEQKALERAAAGAAITVALDEKGSLWSTAKLSRMLDGWQRAGGDIALLVGGPDGLAAPLLAAANARWSLGPLTLPHPLVRVIVAEQIYRAWTILEGHPYHRE